MLTLALVAMSSGCTDARETTDKGTFEYRVVDADTGNRIPAKLTFVADDRARERVFPSSSRGRSEESAHVAYNRLMTMSGEGSVAVPVGRYDVHVSRGLEWTVQVERVEVREGQTTSMEATLERVIEREGWVSADFHVHAGPSHDSDVPRAARVHQFIADGVDVIAGTDHNVVTDYRPIIEELGVEHLLGSIPGEEITSKSWGHFAAYPLPHDESKPGNGAVLPDGLVPVELFAALRELSPEAVLSVNHPRLGERGYFNRAELDVAAGHQHSDFSDAFHAIEVLNTKVDETQALYERNVEDWFAFLKRGSRKTATGNSDTHGLNLNVGGYPRNYVRLDAPSPGAIDPDALAASVKAGRSFFTAGAFLRLTAEGHGLGDVCPVSDGSLDVTIQVDAAPWVPVDEVQLWVGGELFREWTVAGETAVRRLETTVSVPVSGDTFVILGATSDRTLWPVAGERQHDVRPLALTNPIYVDADGNGSFDGTAPR